MGGWDISIFECNRNIVMFLWSCCIPCGMQCMQVVDAKFTDNDRNAALIAGLLAYCLGCIGGVINRYRLRERLNIKDKAIMDVVFWYCLPCCAATQEYIQVMRSKKGNERLLIWEAVKG